MIALGAPSCPCCTPQFPQIGSRSREKLDEGPCARAQGTGFVVDDVEVAANPQAAEPERAQSIHRKVAPEILLDLPAAGRSTVTAQIEQGGDLVAQALSIGQLAKATGVAAKTIRYYEQIGVLPTPIRTAAGYRQYDESGVERLRFIRRARSLGLPIRDVKTVIVGLDGRPRLALRPRLLAMVRRQLSAVQHQSAELGLLHQRLEQVEQRLLTSPRERYTEGCRCLDIEGVGDGLSSGRPPQMPTPLKVTGERASR